MAANTLVSYALFPQSTNPTDKTQLDRLVGLAMLIIASTVFLYYTIWTLLMVTPLPFPLPPPPPPPHKNQKAVLTCSMLSPS